MSILPVLKQMGTLVMIDPSRNLVVAYLTNKINSPVTAESNLNGFDGNCYTASTLGFVWPWRISWPGCFRNSNAVRGPAGKTFILMPLRTGFS